MAACCCGRALVVNIVSNETTPRYSLLSFGIVSSVILAPTRQCEIEDFNHFCLSLFTVKVQHKNSHDFRKGASCSCETLFLSLFWYPLGARTEAFYEGDGDVRGATGRMRKPLNFQCQRALFLAACSCGRTFAVGAERARRFS